MGKRKGFVYWAAGCAALGLAAILLWSLGVFAPAVSLSPPGQELLQASGGLDEIQISAVYLPDSLALTGRQEMLLTNREDETLSTLVLRTYCNAFQSEDYSPAATEELYDQCYPNGFSPGGIQIKECLLDGAQADWRYLDAASTALSIALPGGWQPGRQVRVSLSFRITIPECRHRFGYASGVANLGNAFPILSVWEDGAWRTESYYSIGDPFVSRCQNYTVSLTVPKGYQIAASACASPVEEDGLWTYSFYAPAARDFGLAISKNYQVAREKLGDTVIQCYALSDSQAREGLKYVRQALGCFESAYGGYPYQALTAALVDFPFGGMEYPGFIMLAKELFDLGGQGLEWTAAHETAHQWWYAVVGSDQYYQPWQDEALCEYALLDYVEKYYGASSRESMAFQRIETAMRVTIPQGVTPGSPIDYFGDLSEYTLVTYRRGAALLVALETALGRDLMRDFLRVYYQQNAFSLASRQDFESALEKVAQQDWSALIMDYLDTYIIN